MKKPRIYIVEDEAIIAMDIEEALTSLHYVLAGHAASGRDALEGIASTKPDLVLMDINIEGDMDGIETAAKVQEQFDLPVVFLTSFADKATLDRAKVVEPYGYVLKPFRQTELRTVIELALHKHTVTQAREVKEDQPINGEISREVQIPDFVQILRLTDPPREAMQTTIRNVFQETRPFSDLPEKLLNSMAAVCNVKSYRSNDTLIHEGSERHEGFLVLGGRVAVFKTSTGGKELAVELLGPGDLFGVLAVLERAPFPFSARAQGETRLLTIPREVIFHITESYPEVSRELFERVLERLRKAYDLSRALAHDKVEVRVASALFATLGSFAEDASDDPAIKEFEMTRQELGELVGATPETVSRILNKMETDGVVDLSSAGKVRIVNQGELGRMVG